MTTALIHEPFCLSRPGNDEPRIEEFRSSTYADDGVTPAGYVTTRRCLECGSALYNGQKRG